MSDCNAAREVAGVILAGGRSSRMGGQQKALLELAGRPLLSHVIDRLAPQTGVLALSVDQERRELQGFGLVQVADARPGHHGPLGGLLAALKWLQASSRVQWLLLAPCDAPFVPKDLAIQLLSCAQESGAQGAVIVDDGELQPTFSLWNVALLPALEQAVSEQAMRGFKQFLDVHRLALLEWTENRPHSAPPFFNINDRAALNLADELLQQSRKDKHAECK